MGRPFGFLFMICDTAITFCALFLFRPNPIPNAPVIEPGIAPKIPVVDFISNWLALIDNGNYAASWKDMDAQMHMKFDQASWVTVSGITAKTLGAAKERTFLTVSTVPTMASDGPGPTMEISYKTSFKNKNMWEFVWATVDASGTWQISGYYLQPDTT